MTHRFQSENLTNGSNSYLKSRSSEEGQSDLRQLATEALSRCRLTPRHMSVAGQMGNFGYSDYTLAIRTTSDEPSHLATVHFPYDGFSLDDVHREVGTMCSWLRDLDDSTEIDIQAPVADEEGALCQLHDHGSDKLSAVCTVQLWVVGEDLVEEEALVALPHDTLRDLGIVLRRVHGHGAEWTRRNRPVRIQTDWQSDVVEIGQDHWGSRKDRNATTDELGLIGRTIKAVIQSRKTDGEPWGMTHGDFRAANCVRDGSTIKPIDFGDRQREAGRQ